MVLKLLEESPKCLKCNVPLSVENYRHYCNESCCEGNYVPDRNRTPQLTIKMGHGVFRCPKCFALYYEVK